MMLYISTISQYSRITLKSRNFKHSFSCFHEMKCKYMFLGIKKRKEVYQIFFPLKSSRKILNDVFIFFIEFIGFQGI